MFQESFTLSKEGVRERQVKLYNMTIKQYVLKISIENGIRTHKVMGMKASLATTFSFKISY
jgi:hypothetical protein